MLSKYSCHQPSAAGKDLTDLLHNNCQPYVSTAINRYFHHYFHDYYHNDSYHL